MGKMIKSFGLFQDILQVKIATIVSEKDNVTIADLRKSVLPQPETSPEAFQEKTGPDNLDFDLDLDDTGILDETNKELDTFADFETPEEHKKSQADKDRKALMDTATELEFETGTLSLNLDLTKVIYKDVDVPRKASKKKIFTETKKQFYEGNPPGMFSLSYLKREDNSYIGVSHEGNMELLEQIISINRMLSKKRYHYSFVQPNEIALINALRFNYEINHQDISAIIHISKDYTQVTLTQGYNLLTDLPLINEGHEASDLINTVISRIMLERSHIGVTSIQNYFICGEGLKDAMIEFIKERAPEANVEFMIPKRIYDQNNNLKKYDDKTLAEYIIPIMLSLVASNIPGTSHLIKVNFLPKQLKEQQNIFSINYLGFTVLGLLLISGLISINMYIENMTVISSTNIEISNIRKQLTIAQSRLENVYAMSDQIEKLERNLERTNRYLGNKNQWHYILEEISRTLRSNPLSWLTSLRNDENGFRVAGITNNRRNIVRLSEIFPQAVVYQTTKNEIEGQQVWNFEISFKYPDAFETRRRDRIRESSDS